MRRTGFGSSGWSFLAWVGLLLMIVSIIATPWTAPFGNGLRPFQPESPANVVVIDAGHGGQDSGAIEGNLSEKDLTLDVAQRLDRMLQGQGVPTMMTRASDTYISLAERAAMTNRLPDCMMVSIHFNDVKKSGSSGVETYYADHQIFAEKPLISWLPFLEKASTPHPNPESQKLADAVQQAIVLKTNATNRGTKAEQFFVIANVRHPAVLVEAGFLSNKDDAARLGDPEYRERIALAISDGVVAYRNSLRQGKTTFAVSSLTPGE